MALAAALGVLVVYLIAAATREPEVTGTWVRHGNPGFRFTVQEQPDGKIIGSGISTRVVRIEPRSVRPLDAIPVADTVLMTDDTLGTPMSAASRQPDIRSSVEPPVARERRADTGRHVTRGSPFVVSGRRVGSSVSLTFQDRFSVFHNSYFEGTLERGGRMAGTRVFEYFDTVSSEEYRRR